MLLQCLSLDDVILCLLRNSAIELRINIITA